MKGKTLPLETFKTVVASTPLLSIDLVVKDNQGSVLLGKRKNKPAKGYWFVPGGRVLKDESLEKAFRRLLKAELGFEPEQANAKPLGVYQHFYEDNFSGEDFTTHYVVLVYELILKKMPDQLPIEQHSEYSWFSQHDLLSDELVHDHTKWYFLPEMNADSSFTPC